MHSRSKSAMIRSLAARITSVPDPRPARRSRICWRSSVSRGMASRRNRSPVGALSSSPLAHQTRRSSAAGSSRAAATSDDLPMPASPPTQTMPPRPCVSSPNRADSSFSRSSRPTTFTTFGTGHLLATGVTRTGCPVQSIETTLSVRPTRVHHPGRPCIRSARPEPDWLRDAPGPGRRPGGIEYVHGPPRRDGDPVMSTPRWIAGSQAHADDVTQVQWCSQDRHDGKGRW